MHYQGAIKSQSAELRSPRRRVSQELATASTPNQPHVKIGSISIIQLQGR